VTIVRNDTGRISAVGESASLSVGGTPIPGVKVEIYEDNAPTPTIVHEGITDADGKLAVPVEVVSSANILITSKDRTIARFDASGQASEFAEEKQASIVATPMVEQAGACLTSVDGTPSVEFSYTNRNTVNSQVPVTSLNPYLDGTPGTTTDDLALNTMRDAQNNVIIPEPQHLGPPEDARNQTFTAREGKFTVPFDSAITWYLLGQSVTADNSTALCEGGGTISCDQLSSGELDPLIDELRTTVSGVLRLSARLVVQRRKAGLFNKIPFLNTSSGALVQMRRMVESLQTGYICPEGVTMANACVRSKFPTKQLLAIHNSIFSKRSPIRPELFDKLKKEGDKRFRRALARLPREVVYCPQ